MEEYDFMTAKNYTSGAHGSPHVHAHWWQLPGATRPSAGPCKGHLLSSRHRLALSGVIGPTATVWSAMAREAVWEACQQRRGPGAPPFQGAHS